jgi:hypothetical protein
VAGKNQATIGTNPAIAPPAAMPATPMGRKIFRPYTAIPLSSAIMSEARAQPLFFLLP